MEDVLDVYCRPYDPAYPVVCMDETSKQVVSEVRRRIPASPGRPERYDFEYRRQGVVNVFMCCEPLAGVRQVKVTERRTKTDWAALVRELVDVGYPEADKIVLVMNNLNTHTAASLYGAFPPEEAKRIKDRLEIHHTPKHGSWLNIAEIELSALGRQCLDRRFADREELTTATLAWQSERNAKATTVNWHFTTDDARIKLKRLYPVIDE
jgi:hypothetical protein